MKIIETIHIILFLLILLTGCFTGNGGNGQCDRTPEAIYLAQGNIIATIGLENINTSGYIKITFYSDDGIEIRAADSFENYEANIGFWAIDDEYCNHTFDCIIYMVDANNNYQACKDCSDGFIEIDIPNIIGIGAQITGTISGTLIYYENGENTEIEYIIDCSIDLILIEDITHRSFTPQPNSRCELD